MIEVPVALAAAHAVASLHRDINPSNLLLTRGTSQIDRLGLDEGRLSGARRIADRGEGSVHLQRR